MDTWDVAVVGGGILGTSLGYWLAARYDGRIAVIEREKTVAEHTSRRNTGVVHRPFYLHPEKRRIFARAAQVSHGLWKNYAAAKGLPFDEVGTYEVALDDAGMDVLGTYTEWAVQNGMRADEVALLDGREMRQREPNVSCVGALLSKTDTVVDYRAFTTALRKDAEDLGATFLMSSGVREADALGDDLDIVLDNGQERFRARFLVNCAGGGAVELAHRAGVALEYTALYFRGEYWIVDGASRASSNETCTRSPATRTCRSSTRTGSCGRTEGGRSVRTPSPSQARGGTKASPCRSAYGWRSCSSLP